VLACVEKRGELRWVVGCSLGGERWDVEEEGEEEGEAEEERVSAKAVYTSVYRRNIPSVNPSLISPMVATRPYLAVRV
jgi:hypothetical protein